MTATELATFAFITGIITGTLLGILLGALRQARIDLKADHRRRQQIRLHGQDAVECWLQTADWITGQPNGTPFEGDEVG